MAMFETIYVQTQGHIQMLDITAQVQQLITDRQMESGICVVYVPHTTAGIVVTENRDPFMAVDYTKALYQLIPADSEYRNLEGNFAAHMYASLVGPSQSFIVDNGKLALGAWQSIYFMEFDGGRKRKIRIKFMEDQ